MDKQHTIKIDHNELILLVNILDNFSDYTANDNRPDHGWNRLKDSREWDRSTKDMLFLLNGRLARLLRKTALRGKEKEQK